MALTPRDKLGPHKIFGLIEAPAWTSYTEHPTARGIAKVLHFGVPELAQGPFWALSN